MIGSIISDTEQAKVLAVQDENNAQKKLRKVYARHERPDKRQER